MALKDGVDGGGLDGGWVLIALFLDGLKKWGGKGGCIKCDHGYQRSVHLS